MKLNHFRPLGFILLLTFLIASCSAPDKSQTSLKVFVHESFAGAVSYEFNDKIRAFEEKENVKIEWVSYGNSSLSFLEQMKNDPALPVDLLYGVDNTNLLDFQESGLFHAYQSTEDAFLIPETKLDENHFFTPINYGWLAFEYSLNTWIGALPKSFMDLTTAEFSEKYILANPRTSDIGVLFALWLEASGYNVAETLPLLLKNAFNVAPSWGSAYTLYVSGEAPFVLTYSSSPAYHASIEGDHSQKTVLDAENSYLQVEFMGIIESSQHIKMAEKFLDYMVSEEVQETLPKKVWVFPSRQDTKLPVEFQTITRPKKLLSHTPAQIKALKAEWMASDWF